MQFDQPNMLPQLVEGAKNGALDTAEFGIIGFDANCVVTQYNSHEEQAAGLDRESVLGKDFFLEVAPCMNNFMVSSRFDDEDTLDDIIDYVLTLKMRPTKVKLRLLKSADCQERFLLVKR